MGFGEVFELLLEGFEGGFGRVMGHVWEVILVGFEKCLETFREDNKKHLET